MRLMSISHPLRFPAPAVPRPASRGSPRRDLVGDIHPRVAVRTPDNDVALATLGVVVNDSSSRALARRDKSA